MINPKKDYELLMRYLQGDAAKHQPEAIPEKYNDAWQPPPPLPAIPAPLRNETQPLRAVKEKVTWHWPKAGPLPQFRPLRITTALFAVLLLFILVWKGYSFYTLSPEKIYAKIYIPYTAPQTAQATPPAKYGIENYYRAGNYVAVTLQSKKQPQLSEEEKLLTGLAYMHRDDYGKAIKWLEPVSNNFKSPCRQQAGFYLALAYLKNEDYDRSIEKMEQIAFTPAHPYHNRITKQLISDVKLLKWR